MPDSQSIGSNPLYPATDLGSNPLPATISLSLPITLTIPSTPAGGDPAESVRLVIQSLFNTTGAIMSALIDQVQAAQAAMAAAKAAADAAQARVQADVTALNTKVADLTTQIATLQAKIDANAGSEADIAAATAAVADLTTQLTALKAQQDGIDPTVPATVPGS